MFLHTFSRYQTGSFFLVQLVTAGRVAPEDPARLSADLSRPPRLPQAIPPQQHPVIVLPTVDYDVMQAILEFIYQGQVNVRQSQLGAFLQVAETFSIQGLADDETKKNAAKVSDGRVVSGERYSNVALEILIVFSLSRSVPLSRSVRLFSIAVHILKCCGAVKSDEIMLR